MGHSDDRTLSDARSRLREICPAHGRTEVVRVPDGTGRILAGPVDAERTVPHYARAAMDGYAVRAADVDGASPEAPVRLELVDGLVEDGQAVEVHTGSPIPDGADTVVRVERTEDRDGAVAITDAPRHGKDVAPAGEDVEAGDHLFDAGHRLRPSDLALLRAGGHGTVEVVDRPRVSVVPTGEELVSADGTPDRGEVYETNGLMVATSVDRWGGTADYRSIVGDDPAALRTAIRGDTDHDLVVTTGGTSVGNRDLVTDVVAALGGVHVHGVAIKPGHPVGFGVVDGTPVITLPGYPVSCLVTAVQLLRPAIAWRAGTEPPPHPTTRARVAEPLSSKPGRRSFERVTLDTPSAGESWSGDGTDEALPGVRPVGRGGAGVLSGVAFADGWVEVPESVETVPVGDVVAVQRWGT